MHVGAPLFICSPLPCFITSCFRHPLDRQRKVKCHQLSGQPKVCLCLLFYSICSTDHCRPIPSARYSTPLDLYPVSQIHSHLHTQHCMVKNYPCTSVRRVFSPPVAELTFACLDTMRSRLPAKRSASRPSADVLARTPQAPNRGLCPPFPSRMRQSYSCLLLNDSLLTYLFSPPTPDKPFVFSFMISA
jgi:hypothetical protein